MVFSRVTPGLAGLKAVMRQFVEQGLPVDVFLRTYPMGMDVPTEVEEATKGVRIIQVTEDCLILGPKRPFMTTVIPIDEVASVVLSSTTERPKRMRSTSASRRNARPGSVTSPDKCRMA